MPIYVVRAANPSEAELDGPASASVARPAAEWRVMQQRGAVCGRGAEALAEPGGGVENLHLARTTQAAADTQSSALCTARMAAASAAMLPSRAPHLVTK